MRSIIRFIMAMGTRVADFCAAHVLTDAGFALAQGRLGESLTRIQAIAEQQRQGQIAVAASVLAKKNGKRAVSRILMLLQRVAALAAREDPELAPRFKIPSLSASHQSYLVASRAILAQATERRELLARHGMGDTVLTDLSTLLDEYAAAIAQRVESVNVQVDATNEMEQLGSEILRLVRVLDAMYARAFDQDPAKLATWKRAKDAGRRNPPVVPTPEPGEEAVAS